MIMNVTGRKASLYATAMAISLVALTGTAHAQAAGSLNGTYSTENWALTGEVKSPSPKTLTVAEAADLAAKQAVTDLLQSSADAATTGLTFSAYDIALTAEAEAAEAAAAAAAGVSEALAAKTAAEAYAASLLQAKTVAASKVSAAATALAAAEAELTNATPAQLAAAQAKVAKAEAAAAIAQASFDTIDSAYGDAQLAVSSITGAYTTAVGAKGDADIALIEARSEKDQAAIAFNQAIAADTEFAAALAAVNAAAGTNFTATYDGLVAIAAYGAEPVDLVSNGYDRAVGILSSAAASTNQNISLASGALTGSAAAMAVGANYETEVLGALVNHEGRITANTNAITAETAARIAADTAEANARIAEDKRIVGLVSAETTARLAQNAELRDRISSSTATAIALGGAALLPDMGFTLSGNVAFYEGAQAMALNAAARVGPNAYVTAAVGGGLNKHGSVGGRVGFVFGF